MIGAFFYKPLSPVPHEYLIQPLRLVQSVALAPLAGWLLAMPRLIPSVRLAGLALLIYTAAPGLPRYCTARGSLEALGPLVRGEIPERPPPGCRNYFPPPEPGHYDSWDDYRRPPHIPPPRHRPPQVGRQPAAVLPFPAVNGPTSRLTPFPAAGGIHYLSLVSPEQEDRFAEALDRHADTLVVWTPDDKLMVDELKFPKIEAVIRRRYHPLVQFGHIHVWGRSDCASGSEAPAASAGARPEGAASRLPAGPRAGHEDDAQTKGEADAPQQPTLLLEDGPQEVVPPRGERLDVRPVHVARAKQPLTQDDRDGQREQERVEIAHPDRLITRRREARAQRPTRVPPEVIGDEILPAPQELVGGYRPDKQPAGTEGLAQGVEEVDVVLGVFQDVTSEHAVGRGGGDRVFAQIDRREAPAPAGLEHVGADVRGDNPEAAVAEPRRRRARAAPVIHDVAARGQKPGGDVADDLPPGLVPPVRLIQVRHEAVGLVFHRRMPRGPHARRPDFRAPEGEARCPTILNTRAEAPFNGRDFRRSGTCLVIPSPDNDSRLVGDVPRLWKAPAAQEYYRRQVAGIPGIRTSFTKSRRRRKVQENQAFP